MLSLKLLFFQEFCIKILIFVSLLFINISNTLSADSLPNIEKEEKESEDMKNIAKNLSSEENRKNLKYQVALAFIGVEYSSATPLTFSGSYYLSPNHLLTLRYSNINNNNEKLRAIALGYKYFLGNSFNIMPTFGWRRTTGNNENNSLPTSFFYSPRFTYEEIGAGLRIGNEWQWENFTMGCDWIGINKTILKLHATGNSGIINGLIKQSTTLALLSFYLGYSF